MGGGQGATWQTWAWGLAGLHPRGIKWRDSHSWMRARSRCQERVFLQEPGSLLEEGEGRRSFLSRPVWVIGLR